ncbi:MAG: hypothetical protein OXE86_08005 [Alphaproteobacteria bacterium]|nr:hypothetical protein [Alphaproteobacteria bacterium]
MQDRIRDRERLWERVDDFRKRREESLTTLESRMEKFDLKEQERRSDCIAEQQRALTRIGSGHPEERAKLCAAHREELAGLDQDIAIRRTAKLAKLEDSYGDCFRPWRYVNFESYFPRWRFGDTERREFLERQFDELRSDRAARAAAHEARLGQLGVEHRLERARLVAEHQLELADIARKRPGERASMLADHADELADLDQDACDRCAEYRAAKEEWKTVRDRSDRIYMDWLVTCFLPDAKPETRQWVEETAAAFGSVAERGHGVEVAAAS